MKRCIALLLLLLCVAAAPASSAADLETRPEALEQPAVPFAAPAGEYVFVPPVRARWESHELVARVIEADIFRPPIA